MGLHERFPAYGGRGPSDLKVGIALGVFTTMLVLLRVYVRLRINKFGTAALIWTLAAWTCTVMTQVFGILSILHGLGNHVKVVMEAGELHNMLLLTWITVFFFNIAIPLGKVAVAAFLIEMNAQGNLKIRRSLFAFAAVNVIVNIPQVIMVWFQCDPPDALWDPLRQNKCDYSINEKYTYFVGAVAAVSDFYFAIIPIRMFLPLHIDRKLKIGLSFLMGLGVFAGVAAIVRSWAAKYITAVDSSYGVGMLFLWGSLEEWLVLVAMLIPPIWPLFRPFVQRFVKISTSHSRSRQYKQNYAHSSATGGPSLASKMAPPRINTTVSVSSHAGPLPSPSSKVRLSKYGELIEESTDSPVETETSTAVDEESADTKRNSLQVVDNIRNSKKLQSGWVELRDLNGQGRRQ